MTVWEKLKKGLPVTGSWIQTGNTVAAEILAGEGFDFMVVDMEHTDSNEKEFCDIARAVKAASASCEPMARLRENDTLAIRRVLDCGAKGVIIPLVNNAESAKKAVAAAKYPPEGVRGFAFVRANGWGKDFDTYAKEANGETTVIVMIESKEAVENIDAILEVEGVDGVLIGPYDLSGSYGVVGQTDHPSVQAAKSKVLTACLKHHKAAGQHIVLPTEENLAEALSEGYTFLALGMDTVFLADGAKRVMNVVKKERE